MKRKITRKAAKNLSRKFKRMYRKAWRENLVEIDLTKPAVIGTFGKPE